MLEIKCLLQPFPSLLKILIPKRLLLIFILKAVPMFDGLKGDNASLEDTPIVEESFAVGMDADSVGFIHTFVWLLKTSLKSFLLVLGSFHVHCSVLGSFNIWRNKLTAKCTCTHIITFSHQAQIHYLGRIEKIWVDLSFFI